MRLSKGLESVGSAAPTARGRRKVNDSIRQRFLWSIVLLCRVGDGSCRVEEELDLM